MALHLVHEAALCVSGLRKHRSLTQKGFELSNGLPFVPTDSAIHELLKCHTIAEAQALQVALGKIRRASGHFQGRLLAIDPHRIKSSTKRQMRQHRFNAEQKALKMSQCFFCLDLESCQPLCFTLASAAKTVTQATPELLELSQQILNPAADHGPLVLADTEHYSTELIDQVHLETPFELLLPMPAKSSPKLHSQALDFNPRWAGYATPLKNHFAWSTAAPQSLTSVSLSATLNARRIILTNHFWLPLSGTKFRISPSIIPNAGMSRSSSNSIRPLGGIGPARSTSTSATGR
jgi:hypothetical protein